MQCPFCKQDDDHVVDSRVIGSGRVIRRRRECTACEKRFTTYERIETAPRMVVKKDFRREFFSRGKILTGLLKACKKRGISREQLEDVVDRIESEIFEEYEHEVDTRVVGEKVSRYLKELDPVAFVRFASVWREFSDPGQFVHSVRELDVLPRLLPAASKPKATAGSAERVE